MKHMAIVGAMALWVAGGTAVCAQTRISDSEESLTVRGAVVNSVTKAPVPRALVFSTDNRFAKLTDDEGRFEFRVPGPQVERSHGTQGFFTGYSGPAAVGTRIAFPGSLTFLARKQGYFESLPGQPPTEEEKEDAEEIRIELVPEARIVGKVNLSGSDGMNGLQVEIYRRQVQEGRGQWVPAGSATSRSNGEFRFANLQEGDYKLFTREQVDRDPVTFNLGGELFGYSPVYYPGAGDFESAAAIHLRPGETFTATLTPKRREYYTVKLDVLNAAPNAGFGVNVEPQGHKGPGYSLGLGGNAEHRTIEGLLPNGSYTVVITGYGENSASGRVNFSVNGEPVQGPAVMLAPNNLIEVRVRDERTKADNIIAPGARNLLNAMSVTLAPEDEFEVPNFLRLRPPVNEGDETLFFGDARPGSYRLQAGCNPAAYVAGASSGGKNLLQDALVVGLGAANPPLEITVRDDGAQVNGRLDPGPQGKKLAATSFGGFTLPVVYLVPLPGSAGQFCEAWANQEGEFSFPQVAPGEYRAMAFERQPQGLEYESTEAMKKYESKGQVVRFVAGQKENLRLSVDGENE